MRASQDVSIFDENENYSLKVEADGSINTNSSLSWDDNNKIKIWDGTNNLVIESDGSLNVNASLSWDNNNQVKIWDGANIVSILDGRDSIPEETDKPMLVTALTSDRKGTLGFTDTIYTGQDFYIGNPGHSNSVSFKPRVFMEGNVYSVDSIKTLATGDKVVQTFRASSNRVNGSRIYLSLGELPSVIDNFDSNVETNWVTSDWNDVVINQETSVVYEGTGSMRINLYRYRTYQDTVSRDFATPLNLSLTDSLSFMMRGNSSGLRITLNLSDGTNTLRSSQLITNAANTWELKEVDINTMTEVGGGTTDLENIETIYFRIEEAYSDKIIYIDYLQKTNSTTPENVTIKLYDFGTNSNPTTLPSPMTLCDGTTSKTVTISNTSPQEIFIDLCYALDDETGLTLGNYYGFSIEGNNIEVYGCDTKKYQNGNFYSVSGSTMTAQNKTAMFAIYCLPDEYYATNAIIRSSYDLKNSHLWWLMTDPNSSITEMVADYYGMFGTAPIELNHDGGHSFTYENYHIFWLEHDIESEATRMSVNMKIYFKPFARYG